MLVIVRGYDKGTSGYSLSLDVIGRSLNEESEVMDFLKEWARTLEPGHLATTNEELNAWDFILSKLSERKEKLGVIPYASTCGESFKEVLGSSATYHVIFKDVTSNRIYFVTRDQHRCSNGSCVSYLVGSVGFVIYVNFFKTVNDYLRKHGTHSPAESLEELRSLAQSTQIHTRNWKTT